MAYDEEVEFILEHFHDTQARQNRTLFESPSNTIASSLLDTGPRVDLISISRQPENRSFEHSPDEVEDDSGSERETADTDTQDGRTEILELAFMSRDVLAQTNTLIVYKPWGFKLPPTCFCDQNSGAGFADLCMTLNQKAMEQNWSLVQLIGCVCERIRKSKDMYTLFTLCGKPELFRMIERDLFQQPHEVLLGFDFLLCALRFAALHKRKSTVCFPKPPPYVNQSFASLVDLVDTLPDFKVWRENYALVDVIQLKLLQWLKCLNVALRLDVVKKGSVVFSIRDTNLRHMQQKAKAFHGTSVENVWSILQNGLRHMTIKKNGEAFGKGVYLCSKLEVAAKFAPPMSSQKLKFTRPSSLIPEVMFGNKRSLETEYTCSCVFECEIDISSEEKVVKQDTYYIVKDPNVIKLVKVHFYYRRSSRPATKFMSAIALLIVVVSLLAASGVFNVKI